MKKKQKMVLFGLLIIILIFGLVCYFGQNSDRCTATDRAQNNCVPAGRCTPPGDPREATIDCQIKDYDHKFSQ